MPILNNYRRPALSRSAWILFAAAFLCFIVLMNMAPNQVTRVVGVDTLPTHKDNAISHHIDAFHSATMGIPLVSTSREHTRDPYRWASAPLPTLNGLPDAKDVEWVWIIHFSGRIDRSGAVWNTWARRFDPRVAIVVFGKPIPDHLPSSTITVAYRSDPNNAWAKTLAAFREAYALYPRATYFSKFDDDTYVYSKNLHRRLFVELKAEIKYAGYPLRNEGLVFASGGAGYSVHQSLVESTLIKCPEHGLSQYEDLAMRKCLGVDPFDLVGAHPHHPWQMLRWDKEGHSDDHVRREEPDASYTVPLTYHYINADEMERMHDDFHIVGSPYQRRARGLPKVIHQFWIGNRHPPTFAIESCCDMHTKWMHYLWNDEMIKAKFPSSQLVNQAEYSRPNQELNLLSDIARYEFLLLFGGVYIDADTQCLQPLDFLWRDLYSSPESSANDGACVYESEEHASNVEGHKLVATGVLAMHPFAPTAMLLVKYLSKTDWSRAAWISAGPLFATKLFAQLNSPMTYLPSRLFYPFHHSNRRPASVDELHRILRDKEALTDQLWSTTHNAYPSDKSPETPATTLAAMQSAESETSLQGVETTHLQRLLDEYAAFHLRSLSPVHRKRPRWIVVPTEPAAGMCNRAMNLASALLLALATRRTLLFDWDHIPARQWYAEQTEQIGHSGYSETFGAPRIMFSYSKALRYYGWSDADAKNGAISIDWRHRDFLDNLRNADMDRAYPQSVVFVQRFDWWAPLLLANPLYQSLFASTSRQEAFATLFRFLFPLKQADARIVESKPTCEWFVQIRRKWERKTAALSQFVECAMSHGYDPKSSNRDRSVSYLLSDTSESPQASGLVSVDAESAYCRDASPGCDRHTLRTMYTLARCTEGAILTATSTFGACIAGLGRVPRLARVTASGSCQGLTTSDPALDVGVLDSQQPELVQAMQSERRKVSAAFVYLMYGSSRESVAELRRSLAQLHSHFNQDSNRHYPLVLFVDDASQWEWFQAETSVRVHLVEVSAEDWAIPLATVQAGGYPETFRLRSSPQHKGFPLSYRQMSRYAAGYLLNHPYLERFDYVIKIDGDTHTTGKWQKDPFVEASSSGTKFGFWISYSDTPDVTDNLFETFTQYLRDHGLNMKHPELIVDGNGNYRRTTFYGCFLLAETAFFRRPEYFHLFQYFDRRHGWFRHRWDEQKIYAFYVALYLDASEVEFMDYVSLEHQEWARSPQRM